MRREEIAENLSALAFDFFFCFSRFEFALKENAYLRNHTVGAIAEPGWEEFVEKWHGRYHPSEAAKRLLVLSPKRHVVCACDALSWKPVGLVDCTCELQKVVRLLKTVRNNLFHGGKHGGAGWSDPRRTHDLLSVGRAVLDELAKLANLEADYTAYY